MSSGGEADGAAGGAGDGASGGAGDGAAGGGTDSAGTVSSARLEETRRTVDAVWRIESGKLIAVLARLVGDVGVAEELAQDSLVAALEQWPRTGVPRNAGAWLTAVAKRRAIDGWRRQERLGDRYAQLAHDLETELGADDPARAVEETIDDDLLRLVFISCHPVLTKPSRVALTLKLLGGLTTEEIARAFLAPVSAIAQRIVRAKRTLTAARVPFEVPDRSEFPARLSSVLEVVYLIFNEGYSATAGDDWMRPALCWEALRLGRVLAELTPREPEVHGLVALMEFQASRLGARTTASGEPVLLQDQDRSRWDRILIQRGVAALARSEKLARGRGPYALQAAIAACHATAPTADATDWEEIVALYSALAELNPSAVIELNRAVALSMAYGPQAALDVVDRLVIDGALAEYHLLPSVRADLLLRLGRNTEARHEFEQAAALTSNQRERTLLLERAAAC
ncbi:RNA polymerase sigma factor [Leifsonia poae]|uniref:RNA polymerase sigma factor n=1 Tax=Leifsonia poae TaxID=110933 RepID=A0A9W6H765_9MICO|nr:RNA polymerase sigma factor [Leifsonia poae]GLJ75200.1 RNA polymerase sigma factor [Leifsonia poae]